MRVANGAALGGQFLRGMTSSPNSLYNSGAQQARFVVNSATASFGFVSAQVISGFQPDAVNLEFTSIDGTTQASSAAINSDSPTLVTAAALGLPDGARFTEFSFVGASGVTLSLDDITLLVCP